MLVGTALLVGVVAAVVLSAVVWTVMLAIAMGYLLLPVHRWLLRRGLAPYWSAVLSALVAVVASLVAFVPIAWVLYVRREVIVAAANSLDGEVTLFVVSGHPVVFDLGAIRAAVVPSFSSLAVSTARELATLSAKFTVFAFVVFALLYYHDRLRGLVYRPTPAGYHDVVETVHERVRDTMFGHYLLALLGAAITYLLALGFFGVFGYQFPYALALAAAAFWILPVVSVGLLVFAIATYHALGGQPAVALLVGVFGAVVLVAVPRILVFLAHERMGRPRQLSASVYFVGFVGGLLTVGLVGVVVGPLALAVTLTFRDFLAEDPGLFS